MHEISAKKDGKLMKEAYRGVRKRGKDRSMEGRNKRKERWEGRRTEGAHIATHCNSLLAVLSIIRTPKMISSFLTQLKFNNCMHTGTIPTFSGNEFDGRENLAVSTV